MCFNPLFPGAPAEESMLFHDVHRAHRAALLAALARLGLQDVSQPKALLQLAQHKDGCVNQRELADALHISPATMAASLKSLERNGYVTKQSDQRDGRCKLVSITPKGLDAVQRCHEAFDSVDRQVYAGFTPQEIEQVKQFLLRMLQNLRAIGGDGPDRPAQPPQERK